MSTEHSRSGRLLAGRYRLSELIGEGGMGRVWQGTDELLDRPVAIKELIIPPHLPQGEIDVLRARMLREARSAAQLSHPSIITVFDVVEIDDRPWIVMELVRGPSLGDLVKQEGVQSPQRVAKIGLQVVAALAVAHERGIVHRDIKPGNVLIARGDRAVLTDFGIARLEGTTNLTRTGLLVGSPGYLAPEQAHGKKATPATDMWSLGVTLYQAVQGTTPFNRATPVATLTAIVTEDVPPPTAAGPLRPLIERLLDKDPEGRPSVHETARMLQAVADADRGRKKKRPAAPAPAPATGLAMAPAALPAPERVTGSSPLPTAHIPPGAGAGSGTAVRTTAGSDGGGRTRTAVLLVAAALAVAVAIATGFWLGSRGEGAGAEPTAGEGEAASASPGDGGGGAAEGPEASEEPAPAEDGAPEPDPDTYHYEDDTGFAVDVPDGWEVDPSRETATSVFFTIPGGGYLQVDQTPGKPRDNARADWEEQEPALSGNFGGYELVGITELDESYLDEYVSAADWEFTFDGRGGRMRAVNRAFHTEEKGYALFLVSPESNWEANRARLDAMTASFEPAA
jgi:tRNA A-37 threonylcarbamoyl transferase component Bud32